MWTSCPPPLPFCFTKPLDFSLCVGGPDRPPNSFHQVILAIVLHPSCRGTGPASGQFWGVNWVDFHLCPLLAWFAFLYSVNPSISFLSFQNFVLVVSCSVILYVIHMLSNFLTACTLSYFFLLPVDLSLSLWYILMVIWIVHLTD